MSFSETRVEEGKNNDEKSSTQRMIKPRKTAKIPVSGSAVRMTEYTMEAQEARFNFLFLRFNFLF